VKVVEAEPEVVDATTTPFVLSSTRGTLLAKGSVQRFSAALAGGLAEQVRSALTDGFPGAPLALAVGAIPFDANAPAHLFRPERATRYSHEDEPEFALPWIGPVLTRIFTVTPEPARNSYKEAVAQALRLIDMDASASLRKVVLARTLFVRSSGPFRVGDILTRLKRDPGVTTFAVPLPDHPGGQSRTLVGASPELLLAKRGRVVASTPLAGSARRVKLASLDEANGAALTRSDKDLREHATVVEWVADRLAPFCSRLRVPRRPSLFSTQSMWHLGTPVRGLLKDPETSSLELTAALHPTPAICGLPLKASRAAIDSLEPIDRGYFAGAVGWCNGQGDGEWLLTIRCAEISGNTARLYAGAGIVAGSDPEAEAAETSAKFEAMLRAIGVDEAGRPRTGSL
jgi:isochorismate synthase